MRKLQTLAFVLVLAAPAIASDLQDRLNSRWRGAWLVVGPEISSDCGDNYTNNRVSGTVVRDSGRAIACRPGSSSRSI